MPSLGGRASPLRDPRFRRGGAARGSVRRGAEAGVGQGEHGLVGAGRGHGDPDAADRDGDAGADLQELQADGAAGGGFEVGVLQGEAPP